MYVCIYIHIIKIVKYYIYSIWKQYKNYNVILQESNFISGSITQTNKNMFVKTFHWNCRWKNFIWYTIRVMEETDINRLLSIRENFSSFCHAHLYHQDYFAYCIFIWILGLYTLIPYQTWLKLKCTRERSHAIIAKFKYVFFWRSTLD